MVPRKIRSINVGDRMFTLSAKTDELIERFADAVCHEDSEPADIFLVAVSTLVMFAKQLELSDREVLDFISRMLANFDRSPDARKFARLWRAGENEAGNE